MIIKITEDKYFYYTDDIKNGQELSLSQLIAERDRIVIPEDIGADDEKLLEWARRSYPISHEARARALMIERLDQVNNLIEEIRRLNG
jgi:hypothetical protein